MGQHYLPQEYLRGFAIPTNPDLVWMFDKTRSEWSPAAIAKVAQQRGYFSPETELRLADEVESAGHTVLKSLRSGTGGFRESERQALALYVAVMIKRVPRRRRKGRELIGPVLDETISEIRRELEAHRETAPARTEELLRQLDAAAAEYRTSPPEQVEKQIEEPWPSRDVYDAIVRMTWRFVLRPPQSSWFIACDNPAFFFESFGVGSPESELTFTISPDLALMGSHRGPADGTFVVTVPTKYVKEINRRVVAESERFLFSPRRARWIEALAANTRPYMHRILW